MPLVTPSELIQKNTRYNVQEVSSSLFQ